MNFYNKMSYMAGYFDGEGSIFIKLNQSNGKVNHVHVLQCSITSNNLTSLIEFQSEFGGAIVNSLSSLTGKKQFHWLIYANKALNCLEALHPFLRGKRVEAEIAINFQKQKASLTWEERESVRQKLHELKNNRRVLISYDKPL